MIKCGTFRASGGCYDLHTTSMGVFFVNLYHSHFKKTILSYLLLMACNLRVGSQVEGWEPNHFPNHCELLQAAFPT